MKLKLDANGNVVLKDGMPVYVMEDGSELAFDAPRNMETLKRLRTESQGHRERADSLQEAAKAYEGLDAKAARAALETLDKIDKKQLIAAGETDKVIAQVKQGYETQLATITKERDDVIAERNAEKIGGEFARSDFISKRMVIPADMVQSTFGKHFKLENGKLIGTYADGEKIYSKANPGELAQFDEALSIVVDKYPHKAAILRADQKGGSGAPNGNGGQRQGGNGNKSLPRSEFNTLSPAEQKAHSLGGGVVVDD